MMWIYNIEGEESIAAYYMSIEGQGHMERSRSLSDFLHIRLQRYIYTCDDIAKTGIDYISWTANMRMTQVTYIRPVKLA